MIDLYFAVTLLILVFLQGLYINGVHYCFQGGCVNDMEKGVICSGNIFYKIAPKFFEKNKNKSWAKPLWSCVRCMSSVHGTYTYWLFMPMLFQYTWYMWFVWVFDIGILISVNWFIYQKL